MHALPRQLPALEAIDPSAAILRAGFFDFEFGSHFARERPDTPAPWATPADGENESLPTTSVLVNTFNHGAHVEECIDSLLVQTVLPDEIIVYDSGSTDDTVSRLRAYGRRIVLIEGRRSSLRPHVRQAYGLQAAFIRSSGQLLFLLDGSDRFKRSKIERYASAVADHPNAALIQAPVEKIDAFGRVLGHYSDPRMRRAAELHEIYRRHDLGFFYPTSSLAFPRAYLDSVLPLDLSDGLCLTAGPRLSVVAPCFGEVVTLPETLTEWRRPSDGESSTLTQRRVVRQTLKCIRVFNRFCRRNGLRTISPWRNRRLYGQLLRWSMPEGIFHLYARRLRPAAVYSL